MKNIFITGPTGAIGMALIRLCIQKNINCFVMVRPDSDRKNIIPNSKFVHVIESDLENIMSINTVDLPMMDVFYHLAWKGTTGPERNDEILQNQNVEYTLNAVRFAQKIGCGCFVGAGSQAEYGRTSSRLSEYTPVNPEIMYGKAKLEAGKRSEELCAELGIRYVWTRILSVYGPFDTPNSLISSTIRKLYNKEELAFTKGEQDWDFIYCDDAARALLLIGEKGRDGFIYPIGYGETKKIVEYLDILVKTYIELSDEPDCSLMYEKYKSAIGKIDYSSNQVMYLCADIVQLSKDTGFIPQVDFDKGIRNTIMYFLQSNMI